MGCTQSTERKPTQQQQQQIDQIARASAVASPIKAEAPAKRAESPVKAASPAKADAEVIPEEIKIDVCADAELSDVQEVTTEAAEPVVTPTVEATQEEEQKEVETAEAPAPVEETPAPAAEAPAPVDAKLLLSPLAIKKASIETPVKAAPRAAITSPVMLLSAPKPAKKAVAKKSPRAAKRAVPQQPLNDENAGSPKTAPSALKKAFGVSVAATANVAVAKKAVGFGSVPAPISKEVKQTKAKAKARKQAGKRAGAFDTELFMEQCAAFERQLTHRGTLDRHLNTR